MDVSKLGLDGDESDRNFSLYLIMSANHNGLSYVFMLHEDLLHFSSGQSMTSSIDHIIFSSHYMEIPILVEIARISSVIVAQQRREVLLDVYVVVVEDGEHERGREGLFYKNSASLVWLALQTSGRVDHFNIVAWKRLASRAWLFGESLKSQVVGEDRSSAFSLPVTVIDQFSLKMVLHPLESGNIAAFSH